MDSVILLLIAVLSAAATVISGLVLLHLKGLNRRMDRIEEKSEKTDNRLERLEQQRVTCKDDFVSTGQWTREAGFQRRKMDTIDEKVNTMIGKMDAIDRMPQVVGQIASQIAKQVWEQSNADRRGD